MCVYVLFLWLSRTNLAIVVVIKNALNILNTKNITAAVRHFTKS